MAEQKFGHAFVNLMSDIAKNPASAAKFEKDPDSVMDSHHLSADQKKRIKSAITDLKAGKTDSMRKVVADESVHPDTCFFTVP